MKITTKTTGAAEITQSDLFELIKDHLKLKGLSVVKLQYPEGNAKKIIAILEGGVDQGVKPLGKLKKDPKNLTKYEGSKHKWEGLYGAIGDIIDEQRKRKKSFISYDDLLAELHDFTDGNGKPLFIKNGEKLPMGILRHRLAPSQIVRQAKNQPNLKGVENSRRDKGLKFS